MEDFLWGLWNGVTAWPLLVLHVVNFGSEYPVYNTALNSGWYQFGFLIGAGSPFFGFLHGRN